MAKQDYGIIISAPGTSVTNAKPSQIFLNTSNPMLKIDTQNKAGFQTLQLIVTTDPPNPSGARATNVTTLYRFAHGYTYVPTLEMLCYVQSFPPTLTGGQTYFQDWGTLGANNFNGTINVYALADSTYIYIMCQKRNGDDGSTILMTGTNLLITTHVFVENVI